ncbi:uncharacterized protein LOC130697297 [Daphnia carinata]|uniref:uncharacterized protein LOC130697297 n=1 Tax=Daphnia carinata TaxID=120202 RepID=UPI00257DE605|nr:uncharacterized protein LOC130697297 [Daphnia carinata]
MRALEMVITRMARTLPNVLVDSERNPRWFHTDPSGGNLTGVDPVMPNFYAFGVLEDGEVERRFSFNGIALKETAAVFTLNGTKGAVLRQMTDGHHLIQLIYDADLSLQDCEYITDTETAMAFQEKLTNEYRQLSSICHNTTIRIIEKRSDLPEDLARSAVYRRMKAECRQLHSRMRKAARQSEDQSSVRRRREAVDLYIVPHTKWCGKGNLADGPSNLGGYAAADRCCRQHDMQQRTGAVASTHAVSPTHHGLVREIRSVEQPTLCSYALHLRRQIPFLFKAS